MFQSPKYCDSAFFVQKVPECSHNMTVNLKEMKPPLKKDARTQFWQVHWEGPCCTGAYSVAGKWGRDCRQCPPSWLRQTTRAGFAMQCGQALHGAWPRMQKDVFGTDPSTLLKTGWGGPKGWGEAVLQGRVRAGHGSVFLIIIIILKSAIQTHSDLNFV